MNTPEFPFFLLKSKIMKIKISDFTKIFRRLKLSFIGITLFTLSTVCSAQEGLTLDTRGHMVGNPINASMDLQAIYKAISTYRSRHEGRYPSSRELSKDLAQKSAIYGYADYFEARKIFTNPDYSLTDKAAPANIVERTWVYELSENRIDGSPMGTVKLSATKDLLAHTSLYFFANISYSTAGAGIMNPTGYYMALWDDGQIEKIPYDEIFYAYLKEQTYKAVFPSQSGVGYEIRTWDEMHGGSQNLLGKPIPKNQQKPIEDNGGPESIVNLSRLQSFPDRYGIDRQDLWKQFDPAQAEFDLSDVQAGAAKLKLPLELRTIALDELQKLNAPAIILTSDDKRLVTISALDDSHAIVIDRGVTRIVPRDELGKRYDGKALLPQVAQKPAQVLAPDSVRAIDLKSLNDEITRQVKIDNRGAGPLTLQIERPIPGATSAELSSETVAPGQSATLTVKMKWREVLKTPTQNVVVTLETNDPVRPRLPLGFLLRAPKP